MSRKWRLQAACLRADIHAPFGDDLDEEEKHGTMEAIEFGYWICEGCPVKAQCLAFAVDNKIEYGMWGGVRFEPTQNLAA